MKRCSNCKYWNDNGFPQHRQDWITEDCRRHAPVSLTIHTKGDSLSPEWPRVMGRHWCGDWEEMKGEKE